MRAIRADIVDVLLLAPMELVENHRGEQIQRPKKKKTKITIRIGDRHFMLMSSKKDAAEIFALCTGSRAGS